MEIALDPQQTFPVRLPSYGDGGPVFRSRFLSKRDMRRYWSLIDQAGELSFAGKETEADRKIIEALDMAIGPEADKQTATLTETEEGELIGQIIKQQRLAEEARKKSASPSPAGLEGSAPQPATATATETAAPSK